MVTRVPPIGLDLQDIAIIINEDKRTREEIGLLFEKFDGWKGPPLTVYSSELFFEGPLKKISGSRAQERYFLLFDNLLVIAKKSSVTGRFKIVGTLFTQGCKCESLPDGEHTHGKVSITNGFRLFHVEKQRWYMLIAKDAAEKATWIDAFAKDQEKIAQNTKVRWFSRFAGPVPAPLAKRGGYSSPLAPRH